MSSVISVLSPTDGEVLSYPLAIICGTTTARKAITVHVRECNKEYESTSEVATFPVRKGKFKALFLLRPGTNHIRIYHNPDFTTGTIISLSHTPLTPHPPYVRLVYLLASDSDGAFQTPDPLPRDDAVRDGSRRVRTAGLMIQAATAEMLHSHGFGRRTFAIAPEVVTHRLSKLSTAQVLKLDEGELFDHIASELSGIPDRRDIIDIVVMSFTRKENGKLYGHTALGGGQLALFGGASVFTWPSSVHDIPRVFFDTRSIDSNRFFDDSGGRLAELGRRAITSTTIGALLHELGHCFSLPHPCADADAHGGGIMSRGFDDFDRLFVQPDDGEPLPFWDRGSAVRLRHHRFLQFPGERLAFQLARTVLSASPSPSSHVEASGQEENVPAVKSRPFSIPVPSPEPLPRLHSKKASLETIDPPVIKKLENGEIKITSDVGLGHIGYYRNRDNASHDEFLKTYPNSYILPPLAQLRKQCKAKLSDLITISAMDIEGQITEEDYHEIQAE